jgi:hypothetical protein
VLKINVLGRFQLADNSDQLQKSTEQVNEPSRFVKDDGVFLDALGDRQLLKKGFFFITVWLLLLCRPLCGRVDKVLK